MRIVFMGTPEYSEKTLAALYGAGYEIAAVFAQPDKPVGRKQVLTAPATKVFALEHGIPVYQPATLRDGSAEEILKKISPDLIAVVAYGKILPEEILSLPKFGCVNGHASLLPELRGASPIQWSIVTGKTETGVTTMLMDKGMDTGDILESRKVAIGDAETAGELFERLSVVTAELMLSTVKKLLDGGITPKKQDGTKATYAPIIKKEMAHLDFTKTAAELNNLVRGFNPWPVAFFLLEGKRIKIYAADAVTSDKYSAGTLFSENGGLYVSCGGKTALRLVIVQPEGKKTMNAEDMLRGNADICGKTAE